MIDNKNILKKFEDAQSELILQSSDLSLSSLGEMVTRNSIDISPDFQRRDRWSKEKRSSLIESFLVNIPVPPIYLAEDRYGNYSVIDGKQRITAIHEFVNDAFALQGLQKLPEINGLYFTDLPNEIQNFLTLRPSIRAVILLKQTDPQLKYEVFHRLNTGGEPLKAQEIRNSLYRGYLNDKIIEASGHSFLKQQLKIKNDNSPNFQKMIDVEWVVRFLALREYWMNFPGDYKTALDDFMHKHFQDSKYHSDILIENFVETIECCEYLWGDKAFKRYEDGLWRDLALAGLYDAQMIAIAMLGPQRIRNQFNQNDPEAEMLMIKAFQDPDFNSAIRVSTNNASKVYYRIRKIIELFELI